MDTVHQNQHTLPLPQHRERLHSKRRKKIRHWRRKQRKINSGIANKNASDLSTSSDSDSGTVPYDFTFLLMQLFFHSIDTFPLFFSQKVSVLNKLKMLPRKIWLELTIGGSSNRYHQRKDGKY